MCSERRTTNRIATIGDNITVTESMALAGTVEQDIEDADRRTELVSPVQWHKS